MSRKQIATRHTVDHPHGHHDGPVGIAYLPDGTLLVTTKRGVVDVVRDGVTQETPFVDLRDEVLSFSQRGLLGVTVHPRFEEHP